MALIRWEPAREMQSLQQEMNRLLNTFFDTGARGGGGAASAWVPPMDLIEEQDALVLRADLPGLREEDVSVEMQDNVLTISGERKYGQQQQGEGYRRIERGFGRFERSLTLPEPVDAEDIKAQLTDGVLELRIPKPRQRKPQRIAINAEEQRAVTVGETSATEQQDRDGQSVAATA